MSNPKKTKEYIFINNKIGYSASIWSDSKEEAIKEFNKYYDYDYKDIEEVE